MLRHKHLVVWLFFALHLWTGTLAAGGQLPPEAALDAPSIRFERVEHQTGPSHNTIYAITQDQQGFLWLGTLDGLNRFDGYEFTVHRHDPADTTTLINNKVNALLEDSAGRFWIGTESGLDRFDRQRGRFVHYRLGTGPKAPAINVLTEERDGTVWAGTDRGLFHYDAARDRFERVEVWPGATRILGITGDDDGRLWISSGMEKRCCGLFMRSFGASSFQPVFLPEGTASPPHAPPQPPLLVDRRGALWMGTARLGRFDAGSQGFPQPTPPRGRGHVWGVHEGQDGRVWFASIEGMGCFDPETRSYTQHSIDPDSPSRLQEEVHAVYEDRAGTLWAGTYGGLYRYDRRVKPFMHWRHDPSDPNSLSSSVVMAVHEDARGVLWVGTYGGGLNAFDRSTGQATRFRHHPQRPGGLCSDVVLAIHEASDGKLWLGTDAGLCGYDPRTGRFEQHDVPGSVWFITQESGGTLWLGTRAGVYRFDLERGDLLEVPHVRSTAHPKDYIAESLLLEGDSVLWIGTARQTLFRLHLATGRSHAYPLVMGDGRALRGEGLWMIHSGSNGHLWLGTSNGLSRFDPVSETFLHYFERDGLPGSVVYSLLEDEAGRLWLGTNQGLTRFDPVTESFRSYDVRDGIGSTEFNRHAAFESPSGEFFFGGMKGLTAFFPNQISDDDYVPPVALTHVQASSREGVTEINPVGLDRLVLSYRDYYFSFEFAALSFTNAARNRYAYRLDGFDQGWVEAGTRRFASYTNIPPGDYVFRVKGSNSDGVWNEEGASLHVTITPPFYQRGWFRLLGVAVVVGLLAAAYRARVRRLLQRERLRQLAEDKRRSEEEARRLAELDAAKSRFFANVSHEFRTPLTLILGPLEHMEAEANDDQQALLRTIRRNARRLLRLIDQVLDLSKLEAGRLDLDPQPGDLTAHVRRLVRSFTPLAERQGVALSFSAACDPLPVAFDAEKVSTIVSNLVSNALKFTGDGGKVLVTLSASQSSTPEAASRSVEIVVKDTGYGIPKEALPRIFDRFEQVDGRAAQQGTGIGLALAKELAELHGGTILVESEVGLGSAFIVRLPLERTEEEGAELGPRKSQVEENAAITEPTGNQSPIPDPQSTILVVEDNAEVRSLLRGLFEADYRVLEAEDGEVGLAMAREHTPDLILSDVMMPRMDGMTLCRTLKADDTLRTVPVVLLTAKASDGAAVEGLEAGADDYVTKPFHAGVLRTKLANLLAARRQMRDRFSNELVVRPTEVVVEAEEEVFLRQVLAVVEAQMGEPRFGVQQLADEVGLSRRQLERRLSDVAGQTPAEIIRQMRLERAAQLLRDRYGTVAEVAYDVGFNSPNYFSTAFRDAFGHPPSEHAERAS